MHLNFNPYCWYLDFSCGSVTHLRGDSILHTWKLFTFSFLSVVNKVCLNLKFKVVFYWTKRPDSTKPGNKLPKSGSNPIFYFQKDLYLVLDGSWFE